MQEHFKKYYSAVLKMCRACGIPACLFARCIGIYLCVSAYHIIAARQKNINAITNWQEHIAAYPLRITLLWTLFLFCAASLLCYVANKRLKIEIPRADSALLIAGTLGFSCALLWRNDNFYLCIGVSLTAAALIAYSTSSLKNEKSASNRILIPVAAISVPVMIFVCMTAAAIHNTFGTSSFDMGIFVQMFHSLAKNLTAATTCERDMLLSHFRVHASYIFYLLVPVYALFPHENTLIIAQAVLTVSGVIPLFLIAKHRGFKGLALLSACIIYLFSDGLLAPCYYHFHENAFLPPLLLWLLYVVEARSYKLFFIMSVLVCSVKEDAPLYVICIALYLAIEDKSIDRLYALAAALTATTYFLFITSWLTKNGDGSMMMSTRFGNLTVNEQDGFPGIIRNVLSAPGYFCSLFIGERTLLFFVQMLLPLLFLPFATQKLHRFLLMIPFIIMNLVIGSGYCYAAETGYQYTFGTSALLIFLTVINLSDFDADRRTSAAAAAGAVSVITAVCLLSGHLSSYEDYKNRSAHYQALEACLDTIPSDAAVICDTSDLPHIADRDAVYIFDDNDLEFSGDEIIGLKDSERYDFYVMRCGDERTTAAVPYLEQAGFTVFAECENTIVIYQSPAYHGLSCNAAGSGL